MLFPLDTPWKSFYPNAMMTRTLFAISVLLCLGIAAPSPAQAKPRADKAAQKEAKAKQKGKAGAVAAVLKDLTYVTDARPNLKAKQYKYMQSATWCRFCNLKMPDMVKGYPEMRKQGIEIILISADDTVEKAKAFMEKYNAPFPCVMRNSPGVDKLPSYRNAGGNLPDVFTVAADGTLLHDGSMMRGRKD